MKSFICVAAFITALITAEDNRIELSDNYENVKLSILKVIPEGSDLNTAKSIMEKNGFQCRIMKDASFSEDGKLYEHIDFLYCDLEKGFFISRRWQVAIIFKNGLVVEIHVSTGLTGL